MARRRFGISSLPALGLSTTSSQDGGGYDVIKEDDPFGYIMQGYLYSESQGKPFGGWIAINKSSGEWDFVEAPADQEEDRKRYIIDAHSRVESLTKDEKFKIPFEAVDESYTVKGEDLHRQQTDAKDVLSALSKKSVGRTLSTMIR